MSITPGTLARRRWIANMRWIAVLFTVWFMVTFVIVFLVCDLPVHLFDLDWTFVYWANMQGALIVYVLITVLCVWRISRATNMAAEHEEAMQRDASEPTQPSSI